MTPRDVREFEHVRSRLRQCVRLLAALETRLLTSAGDSVSMSALRAVGQCSDRTRPGELEKGVAKPTQLSLKEMT